MQTKRRLIGTFCKLWQRHENLYFKLFVKALQQLDIDENHKNDEDEISKALCIILNKICFEEDNDIMPPIWEQPHQPVQDIDITRTSKRPDFKCNILNNYASDEASYILSLDIECKKLGKQKGSWNFNKNYFTNGVKRFDSQDHEYGKRASSGMMIGYIVNMKPSEILIAVNEYMPDTYPKLKFEFTDKVVSCDQQIKRKYIEPHHFKLIHLWCDLRKV